MLMFLGGGEPAQWLAMAQQHPDACTHCLLTCLPDFTTAGRVDTRHWK